MSHHKKSELGIAMSMRPMTTTKGKLQNTKKKSEEIFIIIFLYTQVRGDDALCCFFVVFYGVVKIYRMRIMRLVLVMLQSHVKTELRLSGVFPVAFRGALAKRG